MSNNVIFLLILLLLVLIIFAVSLTSDYITPYIDCKNCKNVDKSLTKKLHKVNKVDKIIINNNTSNSIYGQINNNVLPLSLAANSKNIYDNNNLIGCVVINVANENIGKTITYKINTSNSFDNAKSYTINNLFDNVKSTTVNIDISFDNDYIVKIY